uniref:Uncharacterized protein n=1 Tax=Globodera pallida TaxID=36090 RepID=A0A183C8W1_GLOPA
MSFVLQPQMLLKMEEHQKEQRHNQTEICVQIGELNKLVGPVPNNVKRRPLIRDSGQAQMLLRLDEL